MIDPMRTHPQHQAPSGWNAELPPRVPRERLVGTRRCTLAVVGAGFTGVAAARRWARARPDDEVVLLDADVVGEGSSARNSGFLLPVALADDARTSADASVVARMEAVNTLTAGALEDLIAGASGSDLALGIERRGCYRAAATARGARAIDGYRRFLDAAQRPHEVLDAEALAERLGTSHYRRGLHQQDCVLAQPAALIRALLDALPPSVSVHEHSAVTNLERRDGRWQLTTNAGRLDAERVLLANNAWAGRLGHGSDRMTPVFTYAALTPRLGARLAGTDPSWGLLPAARLGTTLRRLADDRLLVRSGYSYGAELGAARVRALLRAALLRRWPALEDVEFEHLWGGSTGITLGARWHNVLRDDGLMVVGGCNGGGVVKGWLFGDAMIRRALGEPVFDVDALFGAAPRMPGEPLRRLGYTLLTALWRLQAGAET